MNRENEELAAAAKQMQEDHTLRSEKEGIILDFLDREVPDDWDSRSLNDRRLYWSGSFQNSGTVTKRRTKVCALEIWCEALGGEMRFFKKADAREINEIIERTPGWAKASAIRAGIAYGVQRGYTRL